LGKELVAMAKKPNIRFIIEEFWNRGYILYDDKYVNAKNKMRYNCMNHPEEELEINWSDFKSGRGCKYCKSDKLRKIKQKDINDIRNLFDSKGLVLVSDTYINNRTDLEFYCKKHSEEIQYVSAWCVEKSEVSVCKYCIGNHHSERQLGEKAYNWKGGVRSEAQSLRETLEYKRWREAVFKRDNYTCQKCKCSKSKSGRLQAHHIYSFSEYVELRHEVDNGVTLCVDCHDSRVVGSFHNTYGTHNNTIEQLEDFLGINLNHIKLKFFSE
jgi:5-methylcytosine-specific restriction endonuclease McrA